VIWEESSVPTPTGFLICLPYTPNDCILEDYNVMERSVEWTDKHTDNFFVFYVVRTVHFGMKLYNDQRNAQVFNLFIYLLLS
jgi:hypothetical protein